MARSAPGVGKKAAPKRNPAEESSLPSVEPANIALNLAPLLTPYKKHRRISIRVERLHVQARLSKGRNNGDNSWSLALDELEDLFYEPPEGLTEPHTLAVRIVDIGAGATLAVLDYAVSIETSVPEVDQTESTILEAESSRRREKLAVVSDHPAGDALNSESKSETDEDTYAALNATLLGRKQAGATAMPLPDTSLSAGDDSPIPPSSSPILVRKGEARPSLVAPISAGMNAPAETGEVGEHALEVAYYRLREEHAATKAELVDRETALSQALAAADRARAQVKREAQEALERYEAAWKADEAARLAAAEEHWRETSTRALLEARAAVEASRDGNKDELLRLRDECAKMQAALAVREAALVQAREKADSSQSAVQAKDAAELRRLRDEYAAAQGALTEREAQLAQLRGAADQAREACQKEAQLALARAEQSWKADTAARLAVAEAKLQAEAAESLASVTAQCRRVEASLAEARAQAAAAAERDKRNSAELHRLSEACAKLQLALAEREAHGVELDAVSKRARETWQRETQDILLQAEKTWKASEAARVASVEAQWQEKIKRIEAEAAAKANTAHADESGELRRLNGELTRVQNDLAAREGDIARLRVDAAEAREAWQRDMQNSLLQAETVWKAAESARLAAAENQWREKVRKLEAEARAQADAARSQDDGQLRRLGEENAVLKSTLADREATLEKMLEAQEQSRESLQREVQGSLLLAERAWKADEANRFAAAEAKWRKQSARALAEATARYEAAETALAQVRLEHSAPGGANHNEESARLYKDLETLRVALVDREEELARARAAADRVQAVAPAGSEIVLRTNRAWTEADQSQQEPSKPFLGSVLSYVVGGAIVLIAVAGFLFYPKTSSVAPRSAARSVAVTSSTAKPFAAPAAAAASATNTAIKKTSVSQGVNLRGGPSTADPVILTLPRGTEVDIVEARGNWTLIRVAGDSDSASTQGWVFSSFLTDPVDTN